MAGLPGLWNRLTSVIFGVGIGTAAADAMEPIIEPAKQDAWSKHTAKVLTAAVAAELVAQGYIGRDTAEAEGARTGFNPERVDALIYLAQRVPAIAEAFAAWRRGTIGRDDFDHVLAKSGIDSRYWDAIRNLKGERLDPAVIALAIVRGIVADPGFLPVGPPSSEGRVRAFPTSSIDALAEAAAAGWDRDRLFVQTAISGRPMGPIDAAHAVFRDILVRVDYDRAIAEGDIRNEWADAIFDVARAIASPTDYVQAHLRGWINREAMYAGTARHGMSRADSDLLYLRSGRPAAPGQMLSAWARGIDGPDGRPMDEAQFLKGIQESDIRPEWGPMLWGSRFNYPSLFQLRAAVQGGAIGRERALTILHYERYETQDATALVDTWLSGGQSGSEKTLTVAQLRADYEGGYLTEQAFRGRLAALGYSEQAIEQYVTLGEAALVKKYRDAGVTLLNRRYLHHQIDDATTRTLLSEYGVTADGVDRLLAVWDLQRQTARSELTPAQIKKAYGSGILTRDVAIAELVDREYAAEDAAILLDE